jgi:protein-S-isoprenylcysteine O-methyltransferase Ste14
MPRLPPIVLVAACALAMWLAARATPALAADFPARRLLSIALAVAGAAVILAGVLAFRRARTTVNPLRPEGASALVTSGVYARTRNPMYLGFALLLLAWGAWLAHPVVLVALPAFVGWIDRYQIAPEERALHAAFGAAFEQYRARVGRWF